MTNCPHCNTPIDQHGASRCLDAWVAEVVMDAFALEEPLERRRRCCLLYAADAGYSTDIAAAWEVVGKLLEQGVYVDIGVDVHGAQVQLDGYAGREWAVVVESTRANTAPLAICRVGLKATSGEGVT